MIVALILASGLSRRFGGNKLLMPLGEKKVIEHVIENVAGSQIEDIFVVYGHHKEEFMKISQEYKIKLLYNGEYKLGQSRSIRVAVDHLDEKVEGAMFLLGDQPFVTSNTINILIEHFEKNPKNIIVPTYSGKRGNPVIFSREFFREMKDLKGDKGPRDLIEKYSHRVIRVPITDLLGNFDIDTREDYEKALQEGEFR